MINMMKHFQGLMLSFSFKYSQVNDVGNAFGKWKVNILFIIRVGVSFGVGYTFLPM